MRYLVRQKLHCFLLGLEAIKRSVSIFRHRCLYLLWSWLIKSDWSMFSYTPECSNQLPLQKYIANWGSLGAAYRCYYLSKSSFSERYIQWCVWRYTSPKIDVFQTAILLLLAPTGNNARASFLVHQVPRTSATVLRYRRMFTQFSLHVWASEYTCRPMIANLFYRKCLGASKKILIPTPTLHFHDWSWSFDRAWIW